MKKILFISIFALLATAGSAQQRTYAECIDIRWQPVKWQAYFDTAYEAIDDKKFPKYTKTTYPEGNHYVVTFKTKSGKIVKGTFSKDDLEDMSQYKVGKVYDVTRFIGG